MSAIRAEQGTHSRQAQTFLPALLVLLSGPWTAWLGSCSPSRPMPIRWRECQHRLSRPPARRDITPMATILRRTLLEPLDSWLSLPAHDPLDINELDFVADSSWYRNPVGGPAALYGYRGSAGKTSPFAAVPSLVGSWSVLAAGLVHGRLWLAIRDGRSRAFVLTFDALGGDGLATGSAYLVTRMLGELGYLVPRRSVVLFSPRRLSWPDRVAWCPSQAPVTRLGLSQLTPGRKGCRARGRAGARRALSRVSRMADGTLRALSTKLETGRDLGPYPLFGVRRDDPNDRIPHERRRSIRALRLIGSWLDLRSLSESTGRDVFSAGRLHHFLWFLGGGLGVSQAGQPWSRARLAAGSRAWPAWPKPTAAWQPSVCHPALSVAQGPDMLWAARLLASLSPDRIRSLVEQAYLPRPLADSLTARLIAQRQVAMRLGASLACAAGAFRIERPGRGRSRLCFRDLFPGPSVPRRFSVRWAGTKRTMRPGHGLACLPLPRSHGRWLRVSISDPADHEMEVLLERRNPTTWRIASIRRF